MPDSLLFYQWTSPYQAVEQMEDTTLFCLDSLFKAQATPDSLIRESLFRHHQLPVEHAEEILRYAAPTEPWIFGIVILLVSIICLFLKKFNVNIPLLFNVAFDSRKLNHILRDNNINHASSLTALGLVCISSFALLGYFLYLHLHIDIFHTKGPVLFGLIWLICMTVYFTRNGLERLLGNIFDNLETSELFINSNYAFNLIESIIILPFTFFLFYSPSAAGIIFQIICWTLGLLFIVRVIRGFQLILTHSKGLKLYLFYYLCTFEVVPIIILIKVFISL